METGRLSTGTFRTLGINLRNFRENSRTYSCREIWLRICSKYVKTSSGCEFLVAMFKGL